MKVIGMVQKRKYSYVQLFFIYTKKKICEILGKTIEGNSKEDTVEKEVKETPKVIEK